MHGIFVDKETGESVDHLPQYDATGTGRFADSINNAETGEPELGPGIVRCRRTPFQIPKEVKDSLSSKKGSSRKYFMELEPVPVGTPFGQVNPVCLFLPAIVYFRWFFPFLMLFEVVLHMWAHHKNKSLKNAGVYFRSPFHAISSEFCALCQNETCMDRVGKIQQIRMHKFLRQCNYMKRVVT